jgi:hypothetical protein
LLVWLLALLLVWLLGLALLVLLWPRGLLLAWLRLLVILSLLRWLRRHRLVRLSLRGSGGRGCWRIRLVGRILLILLRQCGHSAQEYSQRQYAQRFASPIFACVADRLVQVHRLLLRCCYGSLSTPREAPSADGEHRLARLPGPDAPYK